MLTPWAKIIMIATVIVSLVVEFQWIQWWQLALVPGFVVTRPWTMLTYMLVHAGYMHLLFNMLGLFFFGPRLESRLGSRHFLGLYLVSGLVAALLAIWNPFGPRAAIVGASGAVFGVLFAFARYWPRERIMIYFLFPIEARVLVLILAAASIVFGVMGGGRIAHFAHLGGFVGGYLYLLVMERFSPARRFREKASGVRKSFSREADLSRWSGIRREGLHEINVKEIDRLLDKARTSGPESLTQDERAYLDRMSA